MQYAVSVESCNRLRSVRRVTLCALVGCGRSSCAFDTASPMAIQLPVNTFGTLSYTVGFAIGLPPSTTSSSEVRSSMVDGGGPTPSVAIAHAKPLSTNAQPLQSPLPVRDRQSLHRRRQWQKYLHDAISHYGVDSNLVLASKPTPANRKAEMLKEFGQRLDARGCVLHDVSSG